MQTRVSADPLNNEAGIEGYFGVVGCEVEREAVSLVVAIGARRRSSGSTKFAGLSLGMGHDRGLIPNRVPLEVIR